VRPGHILMFILVASHRRRVATQSRVDCSCLLVPTHTHTSKTHTKKKKFAPISRMVFVTRRFVTYGIRAGTTRDLGFTTGSVDMIVLIILLLIELLVCVQVIMVRGRRGGRRRGARGGGVTPPQHPHLRGLTPREASRSLDRSRSQ
jgi:hypothetical protein